MSKQIVIIGNSAAGIAAIEAIRAKDKESKIIVVSDEDYPCYSRCLISYYLAGDINEEKLIYRSQEFFTANNVELHLNKNIVKVSPKKNQVVAEDKTEFKYDYLVLANGASAKFPEIKGVQKKGVFGFRTIKDTKEILDIVPVAEAACVLGGGLIGLKAAYGLKKKGLEVKVIVRSKQVLSQVLDAKAAEFFQKCLEQNGIAILLGTDTAEIIGNGDVKALRLDNGKVVASQIVVVGKGVAPNISLIKETDIKVNKGILVNEYMQTNVPNIYAAGDVCETYDIAWSENYVNALWPNAVEQGKIAGNNIVSQEKIKYDGSLGMNSVEFFGLSVIAMGITRSKEPIEELVKIEPQNNIYKKIAIKDNRVVGVIFVGKINNSGVFLKLLHDKIDVSAIKDRLLNENFSYPDILDLVKEEEKTYV